MAYKTCENCGSRVFEYGCVNCNEEDYITMQGEYDLPEHRPSDKIKISSGDSDRLALDNPLWKEHNIGDNYTMDGKKDLWSIAYYPIFEDGKTNEKYSEPRALIERPAMFNGELGIDFREVPLRYLNKHL